MIEKRLKHSQGRKIRQNEEARFVIYKRLNMPEAYAFLMPEPKLARDDSGNINEVILEYPSSLIAQAQRWRELER